GPTEIEGDAIYQGFGDTIMSGIESITKHRPVFMEGFSATGSELQDDILQSIIDIAKQAEKIVIGLGESNYADDQGDVDDMSLPEPQIELVRRISQAVDKPIVAILIEGRPRLLKDVAELADGIVNAYLPGMYGGVPIAEILYGKISPSGRQPFSYPKHEYQARDTIWQGMWNEYAPQYPFGFGLGYSTMVYSNISVDSTDLRPGRPITVRLSIQNTGPFDQREAILLYTTQSFRTGYQPELFRLRRFNKVEVRSGTLTEVSFTLTAEELAYYNRDLVKVIDPSPVNITINALTPQERTISVRLSV
ncbi:hypothetical protein EC988_007497, partial [Linderina pennispora]